MDAPTEIVIVDAPLPGAEIDEGLKLAVAPAGKPAAERATDELKIPASVEVIVDVPELPWLIVKDDGEDESEKLELKMMSMIGCSSMPLGAIPS